MIRTAQMKADATATGTHRWIDRSNTVALPGFFSLALLQSVPLGISAPLCFIAALVSLPILTDALITFNRSSFGAMLRAIPLRSRFCRYEYLLVNGRERVNHWLASEVVKLGFVPAWITARLYHGLQILDRGIDFFSFRRKLGENAARFQPNSLDHSRAAILI